jgi:predicted TIM-barrel fold metal-dependent hydrolase
MASLMAEAERLRLPVCVQAGLEDLRRQFRPYKIEEPAPMAIGDFARAYPYVTVIALGLKFGQPELMGEPLPDNLYFDTSNYESMGELETAVKRFGGHKILFGSNFPLFNLLANVDKVRKADLAESDRHAIAIANAQRILSAHGRD